MFVTTKGVYFSVEMKEKNKKVYVEFLGLSGAGKTTLSNMLAKELEKSGMRTLSEEKVFGGRGKLFRYVAPVFSNPVRAIKVFVFWKKSKTIPNRLRSAETGSRHKALYAYFRNTLINAFMFSREGFEYFLAQGSLHIAYFYGNQQEVEKLAELLSINSRNGIVFVFVDTPLQTARERKAIREKWANFEQMGVEQGELKTVGHKKSYKERVEIFSFLKQQEGVGRIKKVIKVDGERSLEENINFLKQELVW